MAFSLIASAKGEGTSSGATSGSIDTTGANLIVIAVAGTITTFTISDSKSNTEWQPLTGAYTFGNSGKAQLFYCVSPTVGSGHTFTVGTSGVYASITVAAFSGVDTADAFEAENGANGGYSTATSGQPGSITPANNGALIVFAGPAGGDGTSFSSSSVGTVAQITTGTSGNDYSVGIGYYEQTTAAAINPTLTWSGSTYWSAVIAAFNAAAGGGATGVLTGDAVATASIVGSSLAAVSSSGNAVVTSSVIGSSLFNAVASGDEVTTSSIVGNSAVSGVASGDIVVTSSFAGSVAGSYVSADAVTTAAIVGASLSTSSFAGDVVTSSSVAGAAISAALASGTIVVTASVVGDSVVPGATVASGTSVVTASVVGASLVQGVASGVIVVDSSFISVPTTSELGAGSSKRKKKQYLVDNTLRELDENEVQQLLLEAQQQLPKIKKLEAPLEEVIEEVKKTLPEKTIFKKEVVEASIKPAKKEAKQPKTKLVEAAKEVKSEVVSVVEAKDDNDDEEAMQLLAVYENKREEVRKMVKSMLEGFLKNGF